MSRSTRLRRFLAAPTTAQDSAVDATALQQLAPLQGRFLPWTIWSMRPAAIVALLTDIVNHDRTTIVECGSGNSTVYMARLLRERASTGRIVSIDHDAEWAERTRAALDAEGLTDLVTIVIAPLVDGWYDTTAFPPLENIDLLVVDGPPANTAALGHARERALDHFAAFLHAKATVVLDDARRPGEQEVIASWSIRHRRRFVTELGGHAISNPHA